MRVLGRACSAAFWMAIPCGAEGCWVFQGGARARIRGAAVSRGTGWGSWVGVVAPPAVPCGTRAMPLRAPRRERTPWAFREPARWSRGSARLHANGGAGTRSGPRSPQAVSHPDASPDMRKNGGCFSSPVIPRRPLQAAAPRGTRAMAWAPPRGGTGSVLSGPRHPRPVHPGTPLHTELAPGLEHRVADEGGPVLFGTASSQAGSARRVVPRGTRTTG